MPANKPATSEPVSVHRVDWDRYGARLRAVRKRVFIEEQGIPAALEWDERDPECLHVAAMTSAGTVVATGRVQPDGRIGRMAVLPGWRRLGIGRRLLECLVQEASHRDYGPLYLCAQSAVTEFYARAGFIEDGKEYIEAGIPHIRMRSVTQELNPC